MSSWIHFIQEKYIVTSLYNGFSGAKRMDLDGLHSSANDSDPTPSSRHGTHSLGVRSLDPHGLLFVHVGEHERDVAREQVVHLVAEGGLAQQLGAPHEIADRHVEVRVARGPVRNAREWVRHQDILQKKERWNINFI